MAKIYAQHAMAGKYHLETHYNRNHEVWEWWAKTIKPKDGAEFAGQAKTLEGAMKDAAGSIGLTRANWMSIGEPVEILGHK